MTTTNKPKKPTLITKTHDTKETAMKTTKTSHANHVLATATATTSPATEAAAGPAIAAPTLSPKTGIALVFLQPPPADAKIPSPPQGTESPGGEAYRAYVPKAIETATLPGAVADLQRFANVYAATLGVSGLPYAEVLQGFTVATAWTSMRKATAAWDVYSQSQEGIAWTTVRAMMVRLKRAWEVAVAGDASLAVTYPNLAALFGAKGTIAQKAASTRRLNKEAKAKGEAPVHGAVGKRLQRRQEKAALAASGGGTAANGTAAVGVAETGAGATPAVVTAAPAAAGGAAHS